MDILPRRAQDLTDTPALLANGNFIVDTQQKKQIQDEKTEVQRKQNEVNKLAEEKRKQDELVQKINQQLLRNLINNPPTVQDGTIDLDYIVTTG